MNEIIAHKKIGGYSFFVFFLQFWNFWQSLASGNEQMAGHCAS